MLFNSVEFLFFLPIVFTLYWVLNKRNLKLQNILLLVASYVFYGWWDWRFLSLLAFSTVVDYYTGLGIHKSDKTSRRKLYLGISIFCNLGLLVFFKYYNFFIESWISAFASIGYEVSPWTIKVILPVGISFYTFQTMSYSLDIYKRKIEPTKDFVGFAAFVSFFPQLVAGPIERASHLLPQILKRKEFTYAQGADGMRLILWGLFKKVVIADTLAPLVDEIFLNYSTMGSGALITGIIFFSIQIYCDFSGYSDIAIGTSKLFGIELMSNFKFPYFSRNIGEFWKRWHISLSTWFKDYLYIPLGGSKGSKYRSLRNILIVFLVSGFWHGANWTFIAWGAIHATLYLPLFIAGSNRKYGGGGDSSAFKYFAIADVLKVVLTYMFVTIAWIFFRAPSITDAITYCAKIVTAGNYHFMHLQYYTYILILFIAEWLMIKDERKVLCTKYWFVNYAIYVVIIYVVFLHLDDSAKNFIYFQF